LSARNFNGAKAQVSVDGSESVVVDESAGTQKGDAVVPLVPLYSQRGLDGTKEHTIRINHGGLGIYGGPHLQVYGFM
jgi:hypothetical protein